MPTPTEQLLSRTSYATDGVTTNWDFSFSGGYLALSHIKAYTESATGDRVELTITEPMVVGPYQLLITPALASGLVLVIYRDTPKNLPLVDFTDGSGFSEISLDTNAKQAVFIAAEAIDTVNALDVAAAVEAAELAGTAASAAAASAAAAENVVTLASAQVALATAQANAASAAASAAAGSESAAAGYAASINPVNFATAAQGAKADTALQPAAIGVSVQSYDATIAKTGVAQTFTAPQRCSVVTDNDLSFDMAGAGNQRVCTPTAGGALTFTNITAGQSGHVLLVNNGAYSVTAAASTKIASSSLSTISATGRYVLAYSCLDGTNVDVVVGTTS